MHMFILELSNMRANTEFLTSVYIMQSDYWQQLCASFICRLTQTSSCPTLKWGSSRDLPQRPPGPHGAGQWSLQVPGLCQPPMFPKGRCADHITSDRSGCPLQDFSAGLKVGFHDCVVWAASCEKPGSEYLERLQGLICKAWELSHYHLIH